MSSLSELEYSALAAQTGVSGITLDAQRVKFYDSQTGKSGSNPVQAEISFLQQETSLSTSNLETLWRTYLINQGVTYQANLNDMKRDFWLNYGYQSFSEYIESISGLVAYYPMNESSGDLINNAPDTLGTYDGTITEALQGQAGLKGPSYFFDGTNDTIVLDSNISFAGTTTFYTLFNRASSGANHKFVGLSTDGTIKIDLNFGASIANAFIRYVNGGAGLTINIGYTADLNSTWNSLAVVRDASDIIKVSLNGGAFAGSTAQAGTAAFNQISGPTEFWHGNLQHMFFTDTALTLQEIVSINQRAGI